MVKKKPNISKLLSFIQFFSIGGAAILFFIIIWFPAYERTKQGIEISKQRFIFRRMKERFNYKENLPDDFKEVLLNIYKEDNLTNDVMKFYDQTMYNPEAWGKSGKILLYKYILGSYCVTFGDGSIAILTHWKNNFQREYDKFQYLQGVSGVAALPVFLISIFLIIVFCVTLTVSVILKKWYSTS
ncbi:MAG: hypothetical protein GF364_03460 [Candidatus Lokiarchaeota archaeon]|nr:hypothetical protein [Candidatus Lokiarchaeota archaeon]